MREFGFGRPVPRIEDAQLLRGRGRYIDDMVPAGQAQLYVLRSPHAAARIRRIDTDGGASHARRARASSRAPTPMADGSGIAASRGGGASVPTARPASSRRIGCWPVDAVQLCRRPGRGGRRREPGAGQGRGRARRHRLRGAALGDGYGGCARSRARATVWAAAPDNICFYEQVGRPGGGRSRLRAAPTCGARALSHLRASR